MPSCRSVLACCVIALAAGGVCAAELSLVSGNGYPPFADNALPNGGIATERVLAAFRAMGESPKLAWLPWARGYQLTLAGEFDATFPYVPTPEREAAFYYSAPLFRSPHYVFARPSDARLASNFKDLSVGRLCLPFGWAGAPEVQRRIAQGRLVPDRPETLANCVRMILLDRADYLIGAPEIEAAALAEVGLAADALARGPSSVGALTLHLIVPRKRPGAAALIRRFDEALASLDKAQRADKAPKH